jgi:hypothetical protein
VEWTKGEWISGVAHWREGETAFISVAFSWRLGDARKIADAYRSDGVSRVVIGGPGTYTQKEFCREFAEVPTSRIPDVLFRHNSMATRASYGCPVGCFFCCVPKMDGRVFTLLPDFPVRPVLCDDNLSALPVKFQEHIIGRYVAEGVPLLDANSGFEPKTFDDECFRRWRPILRGPWRFGFDEATEGADVARVFKMLKDISPRRKQVYTMIGHEPFDVCMGRIRTVIESGGEPYVQPIMKLSTLEKKPWVRHGWTPLLLRQVQRWVNRHLWRKTPFKDYNASAKTLPPVRIPSRLIWV